MLVVFCTGRTAARLSSRVPLFTYASARALGYLKSLETSASPRRNLLRETERLLLSTRRASQRAATVHFRVGSGRRTGSSGRFGNGGLEGRGFLDGSCSRPDMRLLSERSATSANDRDFTSGYCQKGSDRQTPAALATKPLIAKTLHDRRGGVESSTPWSLRSRIGEDNDSLPGSGRTAAFTQLEVLQTSAGLRRFFSSLSFS